MPQVESISTNEPPTTTSKIKAVIFDLDGTLLDTEALSDCALLDSFGASISPAQRDKLTTLYGFGRLPWELKKKILGLRGSEWAPIVIRYANEHWDVPLPASWGTGSKIQQTSEKPCSPSVEELWEKWELRLNELCKEVEECRGASDIVDAFHTLKIPMAIATSSRRAAVDKKRIKHENMFQKIKVIVTGDDPQVKNGKPAPDIYLEAIKQLGVNPCDCLVFEDAMSGVQSAKSAGCHIVAVPDPRMDTSVFAPVADEIVGDLTKFSGKRWGLNIPPKM